MPSCRVKSDLFHSGSLLFKTLPHNASVSSFGLFLSQNLAKVIQDISHDDHGRYFLVCATSDDYGRYIGTSLTKNRKSILLTKKTFILNYKRNARDHRKISAGVCC